WGRSSVRCATPGWARAILITSRCPTVVAKTVLLVCHGNTCRSMMAQALLEKMLAERGLSDAVRVRSGGVGGNARDGMIPSLDARIVLPEDGIDLDEDAIRSTDL